MQPTERADGIAAEKTGPSQPPLVFLRTSYIGMEEASLLKQVESDAARFGDLPDASDDVEIRKERRELWERFMTHFWSLAWMIAERRSKPEQGAKGAPETLTFAPEEKLLLNFGVLDSRVTPCDVSALAAEVSRESPLDFFQYLRFTDWFGDYFALLFGRELPSPEGGLSLEEKVQTIEKRLDAQIRRRSGMQRVLLNHVSFPGAADAETLLRDMDRTLVDAVEFRQRTQRVRFADDRTREKMREAGATYENAKARRASLLEPLRSGVEAMGLSEQYEQVVSLTEEIERTADLLVAMREELRRQREKRARFSEKFKGKGDAELRMELQEGLKRKRMFVEMAARRSHLHSSPLFGASTTQPTTFAEIGAAVAEIGSYDPGLFATRRVRVHGNPRLCIMPGRGNGVYDWEDHMLLFPLFPASTPVRAAAQAMALFRWDADDDRDLKDTYANIKDNRGKSITGLQESFCKEYLIWVTKEVKGYRVLPRDSYNWFNWKIAGGSELGADVGNGGGKP